MDIKLTKIKILESVKNYISLFPLEFEAFKKGNKIKQDLTFNDFAMTSDPNSLIKQHLGDIPETLDQMIHIMLNELEWKWFISEEGAMWFFREFRDFAVAKKI